MGTVFFDKINKSILFVPKMSMNTVLTIDGEKVSEIVFDDTQAKKHFKFFWAPDAFTKDYLYTDEWEFPGQSGMKWTTDLKRGGVSVWNWVGDYSWVNNANKFEIKTMDKVVQSPMSPFYGWDHFYVGKYYNNGERTRTVTYDKQNRNFLLGKIFVEDKLILDGERWGHFKIDTRATPYTLVWFSKPVRRLVPITRDFVGQDELTVSAWHTPGKELKFETNLPEFRTMMAYFCSSDSQLVHPMVLLALLQRLIEAVAQGQVRLSLGALDKALNLPGTGASLVLLLLLTILRLLLILLRGLLVLLRWLLRT